MSKILVYKFGGTSVATAESAVQILKILQGQQASESLQVLVVLSALSQVTNKLNQLLAEKQAASRLSLVREISEQHVKLAEQLNANSQELGDLLAELDFLSGRTDQLEKTAVAANILSFGERLSTTIYKQYLQQYFSVAKIDSQNLLKTNNNRLSASICREESYKLIKNEITKLNQSASRPQIIIAAGFIAGPLHPEAALPPPLSDITLLGRGGSDQSAALYAAALDAEELIIWTDVSGIYSAHPKTVVDAQAIDSLTYSEAMELAHFGAKVIYTPAIAPVAASKIPLRIKNTFDPEAEGSLISDRHNKDTGTVCGLSILEDVSLLTISGAGLIKNTGIAGQIFSALGEAQINVLLIAQASSEYSITIAVSNLQANAAQMTLMEFTLKSSAGNLQIEHSPGSYSILSVVGEKMRCQTDTAGRLFSILGKNNLNIFAIAQGSKEISISAVLNSEHKEKALQVVHQEFFQPDLKVINIVLCGVGLIGQELLQQIIANQQELGRTNHVKIRIVGLLSSRQILQNDLGLSSAELSRSYLSEHGTTYEPTRLVAQICGIELPNLVFVDCTASNSVAGIYQSLLEQKIAVVTPNKKAQSGNADYFNSLVKSSQQRGKDFLFETSVGAGLPIIATLKDLINSGDSINEVTGVFSGTLSYLFGKFDNSQPFSKLLKSARTAGFTEPDPREDLNGLDVARKILILARLAGRTGLILEDITVENLIPEKLRSNEINVEDFLSGLANYDADFSARFLSSQQAGNKLCYIARFLNTERPTLDVSLSEIDQSHPFYQLQAGDNIVAFSTERYAERPLIIQGAGAGAAVTAAGVYADIIRLAHQI